MTTAGDNTVKARLKSFVLRIERLEEEIAALNSDKSEVYSELGGEGFSKKVVRKLVMRRKKDRADLQEEDALLDLYEEAMKGASDESDPLA